MSTCVHWPLCSLVEEEGDASENGRSLRSLFIDDVVFFDISYNLLVSSNVAPTTCPCKTSIGRFVIGAICWSIVRDNSRFI
jgi:hypothetical protein